MVPAREEPPELAAYHWMEVPVAVKSATVAELQKVWEEVPVGAEDANVLTVTVVLATNEQPVPLMVIVTEYTPSMAAVASGILGFWEVELYPEGPDHK